MHERQVLHLDLHSSNVLFSQDSFKTIDFGKATLSSFPFKLMLDSDERKDDNQKHKQIRVEEWNVQTEECSDVYSFGILISFIDRSCVVSETSFHRFEYIMLCTTSNSKLYWASTHWLAWTQKSMHCMILCKLSFFRGTKTFGNGDQNF